MTHVSAAQITSLPRYPSQASTQQAGRYLVVTQHDPAEPFAGLDGKVAALTHLALPRLGSLQALQQALAARLAASHVGVRLELHGDEAFLWALRGIATDAGLLDEEIGLHLLHQNQRNIFCVHCSRVQPGSASEQHECCACGVLLEVRRHFSARLGAYLGVCVDADQPYANSRSGQVQP